jgi:hypothetical protein
VSSGRYDRYFELVQPRSPARRYFVPGSDIRPDTSAATRRWIIDADAGGNDAQLITFDDPSFTRRAMRTNVVLRWEFRPGSVFTMVWQQSRNGADEQGVLDGVRDVSRAWSAPGTSVFAIKLSYWYPL